MCKVKYYFISGLILLSTNLLIGQELEEVSLSAFGVYQKIKVEVDKETKFKIKALIKAEIFDESAWAGIMARVIQDGESYGFYDNMADRPITSDTWNEYEVNGTLDAKSDTLHFGVQGFYTGKFHFDNIQLFIEDENGELNDVEIFNSGFERQMKNNIIPYWDQYYIDERYQKPKSIKIETVFESGSDNSVLIFDGTEVRAPIKVGKYEGESAQIGTLITMLEDLRQRVFSAVESLDLEQTDHLHDDKANRIGALIMHLVAAERYYQVLTFEDRSFNEEETAKWQVALDLGEVARDEIRGKPIDFYLDLYEETREETIRLLKTKDDDWLQNDVYPNFSNHYCWFHVMEHQSSHLGQILFLKKRLPEKQRLKN